MNLRAFINKTIILSFFVAAGYLLARSFYYGSFLGIVLAVVAIAAWTYFLYQLSQMNAKHDADTVEEMPG
jgi:ABC-type nickel/cobalt efflux system permease component RcnA